MSKEYIPKGTRFGPLIGEIYTNDTVPKNANRKYFWRVSKETFWRLFNIWGGRWNLKNGVTSFSTSYGKQWGSLKATLEFWASSMKPLGNTGCRWLDMDYMRILIFATHYIELCDERKQLAACFKGRLICISVRGSSNESPSLRFHPFLISCWVHFNWMEELS